ncbi:MAG TPA: TylF/MycF/NovP-related O-methyltransferase [Candidatus Saccharimonadales bacterium]|nr:TylF/MycF/NovP-related O-methyltransferase [Candidatus Saccharimonadales bacterium]
MDPRVLELVNSHRLISDQIDKPSLIVVLDYLNQVLVKDVPGDIVEMGCYIGTTSLFIERLLSRYPQPRDLHVYDSFEGLPAKQQLDQGAVGQEFKEGELRASKKELVKHFRQANLRQPVIHKGWFKDLKISDLPGEIAFAFLDGDFYESILLSLKLTWPKLAKGGIICIDDYNREALPGVEKAVTEYFQSDKAIIKHANIGIIRK